MKIIIMGAGTSGFELAKRLVDDGNDVVVIDTDSNILQSISNKIDCRILLNEGDNFEAIQKADVTNANFFFALTTQDEVNILACRFASSENKNLITIAGVKNYSYSFIIENKKDLFGIDYIVNAKLEAAKHAITSIEHGLFGNPIHIGLKGFALRENKITYKSSMMGKTVQELRSSFNFDFVISAIYRNMEYIIPNGNTVVKCDDIVYFFSHIDFINNIFETNCVSKGNHNILVYGATDIGLYIANHFKKHNTKKSYSNIKTIAVMDKNKEACLAAVEKYPNLTITQDSIIDDGLTNRFKIYDMCICATDNEELNLVSALYVKNLGIKSTLAIIKEKAYMNMSVNIDVDSTISMLNASVDRLIHIVNSKNVKSLHSIFAGEIEVIEFTISSESKIKNKLIKDTSLPKEILILFILRDEEIHIPTGNFELMENDVFACIGKRNSMKTLQGYF